MRLERKDLKPYRRMFLSIKEMSEQGILSVGTIHKIENTNEIVTIESILSYITMLLEAFKKNGFSENGKEPEIEYFINENEYSVLMTYIKKTKPGQTVKLDESKIDK
jgi:hypothetical protein